jgi:hypothetical protein
MGKKRAETCADVTATLAVDGTRRHIPNTTQPGKARTDVGDRHT